MPISADWRSRSDNRALSLSQFHRRQLPARLDAFSKGARPLGGIDVRSKRRCFRVRSDSLAILLIASARPFLGFFRLAQARARQKAEPIDKPRQEAAEEQGKQRMHASCAPSLAYRPVEPCLLRGCRLRQFGRRSRKCGNTDAYSSEKPKSLMPLTTRPAATKTAPRRIASRMAIPFQGVSRFGVMALLTGGARPLAPKQRPGAKRKRRVEDREGEEEMRERAG
jgi:hypothetical protein